jgi:hypothetical protein
MFYPLLVPNTNQILIQLPGKRTFDDAGRLLQEEHLRMPTDVLVGRLTSATRTSFMSQGGWVSTIKRIDGKKSPSFMSTDPHFLKVNWDKTINGMPYSSFGILGFEGGFSVMMARTNELYLVFAVNPLILDLDVRVSVISGKRVLFEGNPSDVRLHLFTPQELSAKQVLNSDPEVFSLVAREICNGLLFEGDRVSLMNFLSQPVV